MKTKPALLICLLFLQPLLAMAGVPSLSTELLCADINDKPLGEPIGTGGASDGEPFSIFPLDTEVVNCPDSPCLRVDNDLSASNARSIRWQFLGNAEITTGVASLRFTFIPSARDRYAFAVRERGSSTRTFLTIRLDSFGNMEATDAQGVIPLGSFTYSANQRLDFQFDFDLDAGTSQATVNGAVLFTERLHGITARGVGALLTGFGASSAGNSFLVDDVIAQTEEQLPLILTADLENEPLNQALQVGDASNNRPVFIDPAIVTRVVLDSPGDNAVRISLPAITGASTVVRWHFLDDIEVLDGVVAVETDVQFANLNQYLIVVRENTSSSADYTTVLLSNNGQIIIFNGVDFVLVGTSYSAGVRYRLRLIFDQDRGTYSAFLNDTAMVVDRPHGVTNGRGIGSVRMGFQSSATAGAAIVIDDLQVGASRAEEIASEIAIIQQPTSGTTGQPLAPTLEIGAINVFDDVVSGATVSIDASSAPPGAALSNNVATTVEGVARFPQLRANTAGVYRLRASADGAQVISATDLIVKAAPESIFRNGFEAP